MSDRSSIEWTDASWNPLRGTKGRHHCVRISEGCKHCYAATMNHRFGGPDYVKGADAPRLDADALLQPLKWRKPRRIFVCSMTDLFMDEHSDEMIDKVFAVMALAPRHAFQVLTKRAKRMRDYVSQERAYRYIGAAWSMLGYHPLTKYRHERITTRPFPLPNVWLGVSAENQERADERIPDLLATPAAVRFVSAEPLLGPIDFEYPKTIYPDGPPMCCSGFECGCMGKPVEPPMWWTPSGVGIDWVIVGGESGPGARPCDVQWIRSIKDQCDSAGVACFVKQLGARPIIPASRQAHWDWGGDIGRAARFEATDPLHESTAPWRVVLKDKKGGEPSEWPADLRVRQMPGNPNV